MKKPNVMLKLATSIDGRIAVASGESQWITGAKAREKVHQLRSEHSAIAVGSGTAGADNPSLTVRIDNKPAIVPARILFDSRLQTPATSRIFAGEDDAMRIIFTHHETSLAQRSSFKAMGVKVFGLDWDDTGFLNLDAALDVLSDLGLETLMVEGGGKLASSFLAGDLVDEIAWFIGPVIIGQEGVPMVGPMDLAHLSEANRFSLQNVETLGEDLFIRYLRQEVS